MGMCTHANKTKGTFARFSTCSKWGQCSCRVQTMFSPCVAIICRKWVGSNLITIPSYVATVYPHVINVPRNRTQTKQGTGAWTGSAVTLGTSVLGCTTYPRVTALLYTSFIWNYHQGIRMGCIYIIHIYIYIYTYNYAYVCICFWVINMYKPSSDWDAPPSMADSSAI